MKFASRLIHTALLVYLYIHTFILSHSARPSYIQVRLAGGTLMGRAEVRFIGVWGTVCDDSFGTTEANVFCRALGFNRAMCSSRYSSISFSPGTGNCYCTLKVISV